MVLYRQRFNKLVQNRLFVQSPPRERGRKTSPVSRQEGRDINPLPVLLSASLGAYAFEVGGFGWR